jgi:hypothetical protein
MLYDSKSDAFTQKLARIKSISVTEVANMFKNMYWSGKKRTILDNAWALSPEKYIVLMQYYPKTNKQAWSFVSFEDMIADAGNFEHLRLEVNGTMLHGMSKILLLARHLNSELGFGRFLMVVTDIVLGFDDEQADVQRCLGFWS